MKHCLQLCTLRCSGELLRFVVYAIRTIDRAFRSHERGINAKGNIVL